MATTTILSARKDTSIILKNSSRDTWMAEKLYAQSSNMDTNIGRIVLDIANKDRQDETREEQEVIRRPVGLTVAVAARAHASEWRQP